MSQIDRTAHVYGIVEYARQQAEQAEAAQPIACDRPVLSDGQIPGYVILDEMHRGGQGVVYRARQVSTGRVVAVKVLRHEAASCVADKARIDRELRLLAQLKHPNIVNLQDGGVANGLCFLVMDFVEGESLDIHVQHADGSIKTRLGLMIKICEAVHAAHVRGIVHRDLKPSNIRVDAGGEPRVLDFGLAKLVDGRQIDGLDTTGVTATGQFVGSLPWAAPEQVDSHPDRIDIRTDVYALGVVLYVMTTGSFPYEVGGSVRAVMDAIAFTSPVRPREVRADIDRDLETIILKCLSKERERRYESAGQLASELRRYLAGEPIEARRDSTWYVLSKLARRHRIVAGLLGLVLAITAAYAVTMTVMYQRVVSAEAARAAADENARERLRQTYEAVKFLFDGTSSLSRIAGAGGVRRDLLLGGFDRLKPLVVASADDASVQRDLANANHLLCDIAEQVGNIATAREHCETALRIFEKLSADGPGDAELLRKLAFSLVRVGDMAKAEGRRGECRSFYVRAMEIHLDLLQDDPANVRLQDDLMWSYERLGDQERLQGNLEAAWGHHEKQLELAERLLNARTESASTLLAVYSANMQLTTVAKLSWDWVAWTKHLGEAEQAADACVQIEPRNPQCLAARQDVWTHRAEQAFLAHDLPAARHYRELAHGFAVERYNAEPDVHVHRYGLIEAFFHLGVVAQEEGSAAEAEESYRSALDLNERHGLSIEAVDLRKRLAMLAGERGDVAAAQALRLEAFEFAQRNATVPDASAGTILIAAGAARDLFLAGSPEYRQVAIDACQRAEEGMESPTAESWYWAGVILHDVGEADDAVRCLRESLARIPPGESPLRQEVTTALAAIVSGEYEP